jgi:fatty acid-binding protein DegV
MRFMITCRIPVEEGKELARAGSLHSTIHSIMEELKPEAAYFSDIEGGRSGYIVVNMDDASEIAARVEPLLLRLGATIQIHPVMTPEELGQATLATEQASQKEYG